MVGRPRLVESSSPFLARADDKGIHVTDPAQLGEVEANYPLYERGAGWIVCNTPIQRDNFSSPDEKLVEQRGFEPLTPTMPLWCSTN